MMMLDSGTVSFLMSSLQHRKLADRPQFQQRGALGLIAEIDEVRRERRVVLVQGDQRLPAERRQRVKMQRQRHGNSRLLAAPLASKTIRTRLCRHLPRNYCNQAWRSLREWRTQIYLNDMHSLAMYPSSTDNSVNALFFPLINRGTRRPRIPIDPLIGCGYSCSSFSGIPPPARRLSQPSVALRP